MSSRENVAIHQLLALLEARYALRVLWSLRDGHAQTFRLLQDSVGGITPNTLNILPPNLVGMVAQLEKRGVIERLPHPHDRRAAGLHLTPDGEALVREAELRVSALEEEATSRLTTAERKTLMRLLQKIYR